MRRAEPAVLEPPERPAARTDEEKRSVQLATHAAGPLLQRDWVIVLEGSACSPDDVVQKIREEFPRFSPERYCTFTRPADARGALAVGDTMHVHLRGAGRAGVLVTHVDACRLTLRTQEGHQEAGRITFGATYDSGGRVVVRIRSRSRQRNFLRFLGYSALGLAVQSRIW